MAENQNPYSAPQAVVADAPQDVVSRKAGKGSRLLNFLIDMVFYYVFLFIVSFIAILLIGDGWLVYLEQIPEMVLGGVLFSSYYILFEGVFGVTLGKLITGTRVVNDKGQPPSFGQTVGRSFMRIVPFEPFSFLGQTGRGWHDSVTNTYVVSIREEKGKSG